MHNPYSDLPLFVQEIYSSEDEWLIGNISIVLHANEDGYTFGGY
mgnify:CR=1